MTLLASRTPAYPGPAVVPRRWLGFTRREHVVALALFAVVTLAFFLPLVRGDTFSDVGRRQAQVYPWAGVVPQNGQPVIHYDQDDSFYPWQVFMSRVLRDGEFPLWNRYSFAGSPFFANGQSGVLYPPRLALTYVTSPTRVHDVLLATHLFLAGVAMFLLLAYARLSFPSALVGGFAWMLNSFALAWQALEHYLVIEAFLPVGVLLADMAVRRRSWRAVFGLALVLALLYVGGNVLFAELAIGAVFAYALGLSVVQERREWRGLLGHAARLATAAALFAGLTAVSLLPTFGLTRDSARVSLTYSQLGDFALPWHALANVFKPPPNVWVGEPYHHNLFAGTAVGLLALVGLARRDALARFAAVLGIVAILFMLHTPMTFVVDHLLPGLSNLKPLARAAFLLEFALAVLAAYGLETTLTGLRRRKAAAVRRSPIVFGALVGGVLAGLVVRLATSRTGSSTALVLGLAVALAAAVVLELAAPARRAAGLWDRFSSRLSIGMSPAAVVLSTVVAASIVGQMYSWKRHVMLHQPDRSSLLYPSTPLIRYLARRGDATFLPTASSFRGSTAMIYSLESAGGYESLLPERVQNFWRVVAEGEHPDELESHPLIYAYQPRPQLDSLRPALLARAGVAYVVAGPRDVDAGPGPSGLVLRYDGADGRVYAVSGALPRAYVVGGCDEAATPLAALEHVVAPGFAAGRTAVLERSFLRSARVSCGGDSPGRVGTAVVRDRRTNSLLVHVDARRTGWLVVNESWERGWTASIDGRSADVLPANYAMRAVRVPPGAHDVRLTYRPSSFRLGAGISALALVLTLGGLGGPSLLARVRGRA